MTRPAEEKFWNDQIARTAEFAASMQERGLLVAKLVANDYRIEAMSSTIRRSKSQVTAL